MLKQSKKIMCCILLMAIAEQLGAQQAKPSVKMWDGMAVAGYVNQGGFLNFGGPTVKRPLPMENGKWV